MSATVSPPAPLDERIQRWADTPPPSEWAAFQKRSLIAAGAGAVLFLGLGLLFAWLDGMDSPRQYLLSYLVGYTFWLAIALGCLALLMIHHLAGGGWGLIIRRTLEAGTSTLIPLAVLFIPFCLGLRWLYLWAEPGYLESDPHLKHKALFFAPVFFYLRAAVYFVIWLVLGYFMVSWSRQQDRQGDPALTERMQTLSGPGLLLLGLSISFATIDWMMSLEPKWYSVIYPVMVAVGFLLSGFAFAVAMVLCFASKPPLSEAALEKYRGHLGNLMLAFVMLWAYMSLSQYLLIWVGNLKEEIPWYIRRTRNGWEYLAVPLVLFHFFLPFFLLLVREVKRSRVMLMSVAVGLLVIRFFDLLWLIEPAYPHEQFAPYWLLDVAALVSVGGVFLWWFLEQIHRYPLLPVRDPDIAKLLLPQEEHHAG